MSTVTDEQLRALQQHYDRRLADMEQLYSIKLTAMERLYDFRVHRLEKQVDDLRSECSRLSRAATWSSGGRV